MGQGEQEGSLNEDEAEMEAEAIERFKKSIADTIAVGAGDEATALRWMTEDEYFGHIQDIESWVWDKGMLFTKYGKDIVGKLTDMYLKAA